MVKEPDGEQDPARRRLEDGFAYRPKEKLSVPSLGKAKKTHDVATRLRDLVAADDRAGVFAWRLTRDTLVYASTRFGEISDEHRRHR